MTTMAGSEGQSVWLVIHPDGEVLAVCESEAGAIAVARALPYVSNPETLDGVAVDRWLVQTDDRLMKVARGEAL